MKKATYTTCGIFTSLIFIYCLLLANQANALIFSTVNSGNWSSSTTWSTFRVPGIQDSIKISSNHTINIDVSNATVSYIYLESGATLNGMTNTLTVNGTLFNNGGTLSFPTATLAFSGYSNITAGKHIIGNLTINTYANLTSNTPVLSIGGNWTNNGTFIPNKTLVKFIGKNQTIAGTAQVQNFYSLFIDIGSGATLYTGRGQNIIISQSLNLKSGYISMFAGTELNITNPDTLSSLVFQSGTGIQGNIRRAVLSYGTYVFPLANNTQAEFCTVSLKGLQGLSNILVSFNNVITGNPPALSLLCVPINDQLNAGIWSVQPDYPPYSGFMDITLKESGFTNAAKFSNAYTLIKRTSNLNGPGPWTLDGYNPFQKDSSGFVTVGCSALTSFGEFSIGKSVSPIPSSPLTALITKTDPICGLSNYGSAIVDVFGGTKPYSYSWHTNPVQTTQSAVNLKAGYDTVIVTDANNCVIQASTNIIFKAAPNADFTTGNEGNTIYFNVASPVKGVGYSWDFGDNTTATGLNPIHTYSTPGGYMVTLNVMDSMVVFCQANTSKYITVGIGGCTTLAEFSFTQDSLAKTVSFNDKSIGKNLKYYWDYGNGSFSSQSNPYTYKYPVGGNYSVCLTVIDTVQLCQSSTCHVIKANNMPDCKTKFMFFTDSGSNKIQFDGRSLNTAGSYSWDFGNGDYSNSPNPSYTYPAPGYYNVCLTTHDSILSGCQSQYCENVHVGKGNCLADFTAFPNATTLTVDFKDASLGAVSGWHWDFGNGNISNTQNPIYTYSTPGFYEVCLTDSSPGCQNTSCKTIHVGAGACNTDFTVFTNGTNLFAEFKDASIGGPIKWAWEFGDGQTDSIPLSMHTYSNNGIYTACLTTINAAGCINHKCQDITVGPIGTDCLADFEMYEKNKVAEFNNTSIGNADTYFWDFGDGTSSPLKFPAHTYTTDGYYTVSLTIYNSAGGCFNTSFKKVTIGTLAASKDCEAIFSAIADPVTKQVKFKDESYGNPISWTWNFSDSTSISNVQHPNHTFRTSGFKEVCLTIVSANGSSSSHCNEINIGQTGLSADFSYSENKNFYFKNEAVYPISFYGSSYGKPSKWKWSFGDASYDSLRIDVTHNYATTGSFNTCLTVTDPNSKLASNHCKVVKVGSVQGLKENTTNSTALSVYPNPLTNQGVVSYFIEKSTMIHLSLYDLQGRRLKTLAEGEQQGFVHQAIDISDLNLAPGMYLIQLTTKGSSNYKPLIISK
jgi:PKD repeat protein